MGADTGFWCCEGWGSLWQWLAAFGHRLLSWRSRSYIVQESWVCLGGGSSALELCGVGIVVVMVGGLQSLTVVAGVSILCGAEFLDTPIFIMSFYLYCIVTHHIIVLCYCGL